MAAYHFLKKRLLMKHAIVAVIFIVVLATGQDMDECASNPCQNDGQCVNGDSGYTCNCTWEFTGKNCEKVACIGSTPYPCKNHGNCLNATCWCDPGYTGILCETDIDECASEPCQFGGNCTESEEANDYTCSCTEGFTGVSCETEVNPSSPSSTLAKVETAAAEITTMQLTTASPAAPNIYPEPYVTMALNGSLSATYAIDSSCSSSFSNEFRNSFNQLISRVNDAIVAGQLCVGDSGLGVVAGSVQFTGQGTDGRVTFNVAVGVPPSDVTAIRSVELCSYDVSSYVQDFSNWRQPIISNIYNCPTVTFSPETFHHKSAEWSCF